MPTLWNTCTYELAAMCRSLCSFPG